VTESEQTPDSNPPAPNTPPAAEAAPGQQPVDGLKAAPTDNAWIQDGGDYIRGSGYMVGDREIIRLSTEER
jgi:hypothetical protein